ncbi:hypothetical protein [Cellulomonas chengniuliangii]|uniref:hypothetical protein n=1 Tax=Cellulomonas chengniuliangii TaxID=2968084 RepID=UPI001D0DD63D|nr:hypothetical protein [Cellulomonas chengniuliangii]MCC2317915.1 hypothetical protein [Cellulomonas chengniuliangii]
MPPPVVDVLPDEYVPARMDAAWLATLTDDTSWRAPSHAVPTPPPFRHLDTRTLADAGTAPLFDLEHAHTAWFYNIGHEVSDAHVNPAPMTAEQFYDFNLDRAVLDTHEKRAIAHRGNLLRLWPAHSDVTGEYSLVCAPTPQHPSQMFPVDGLIVSLSATDLPAVVRDVIVASARMNTTVLLARKIDRDYPS